MVAIVIIVFGSYPSFSSVCIVFFFVHQISDFHSFPLVFIHFRITLLIPAYNAIRCLRISYIRNPAFEKIYIVSELFKENDSNAQVKFQSLNWIFLPINQLFSLHWPTYYYGRLYHGYKIQSSISDTIAI